MMAYSLRWRRNPGESGGTTVGGVRRLMTAGSKRSNIQEDETIIKKWKQGEVSMPLENQGAQPPASPPLRPPLARAYPRILLNQTANIAKEELLMKYRKELLGLPDYDEEIITENEFQEIYRRKTPMIVSSSSEGSDDEYCGLDGRRNERNEVRKSLGEDELEGFREGKRGEREAARAKTEGKRNRNMELEEIEKKIGINNIWEGGRNNERDRAIDDKERFKMEMKKKTGEIGEKRLTTEWRTNRELLKKNEIRERISERVKEKIPTSRIGGLTSDERKWIHSREIGKIEERRKMNQRENERIEKRKGIKNIDERKLEENRGINQTVIGRMGEKRVINERESQRIAGRIVESQRERVRIRERK